MPAATGGFSPTIKNGDFGSVLSTIFGSWVNRSGVAGHGGRRRSKPTGPSDPYLMTGYDEKRVELSHDADGSVTFEIQVDFDHQGFRTYKTLEVPAGKRIVHSFERGFHAHWARVSVDRDCTASAWFVYE